MYLVNKRIHSFTDKRSKRIIKKCKACKSLNFTSAVSSAEAYRAPSVGKKPVCTDSKSRQNKSEQKYLRIPRQEYRKSLSLEKGFQYIKIHSSGEA